MTVTYTSEVSTCGGISRFLRLLARWRGSIYKIVWVDLMMFLGLYYLIMICYRYGPESASKTYFEKLVRYCDKYLSLVPLSFILGFYVNLVMTRWWSQYQSIPFPDNLAILVGASIKGQGESARIYRRTIMRYVCATFTITLTMMSPKVKKRFPTLDHFIDAGLLTKEEKKIINDIESEFPSYKKYWLPLAWAANLVTSGRHQGFIRDDVSVKTILEEMNSFRSRLGGMLDYDWISVPLVYTQVVTLVVYLYFILSAIAKQYIDSSVGDQDSINLYFPFFPVLEFFFYMGWLKVAEVLINPYGDDDDDFEVVWMIDRHLQVSYLLVDKIHEQHPQPMRDVHWDETAPNGLPFTVASQKYMREYPFPSTLNVEVTKSEQDLLMPLADTTQTDGARNRSSSSYLWRLNGQHKRQAGSKSEIPLTKVTCNNHDEDQQNSYTNNSELRIPQQPCVECQSEEFEKLKNARIAEYHQKLQQYVETIIKKKREEYKKLDDIAT